MGAVDTARWTILKKFQQAWQRGQRPSIAEYLAADDTDRDLLVSLIHVDLERRLEAGEMACVEAYLGRYPQLRNAHGIVFDLVVAELQQRQRRDPLVSVQEYVGRFPQYRDDLLAKLAEQTCLVSSAARAEPVQSESPAPKQDAAGGTTTGDPRETFGPVASDATLVACSPPKIKGYEILGLLGRGAKTVVYRACQLRLNRIVALKMLAPDPDVRSEDLVRFLNEVEVVARLQHPNIVQIYEVGAHESGPFFTMEYLQGGRLDQMLAGTPLLPRPAARLIETLALAIHAAHQHGVIHRDLKPANVLLAEAPRPRPDDQRQVRTLKQSMLKVIDFGVAKRLHVGSGLTREGDLVGTPSYMAPEQAQGKLDEIGPLTDVYGLGAILYELLTGRPPFKAATVWRTVSQVLHVEPVAPSKLDPKLHSDLEAICLKCLAKNRTKRYPSAAALAEDVWRFLHNRAVDARVGG
jgi:eukaryotic-like serine/threonine-protein kinase